MERGKIRYGFIEYILVTGWPPLALIITGKFILGAIVSIGFILAIPVSHGIAAIALLCGIPFAWARLRHWERNGFREG